MQDYFMKQRIGTYDFTVGSLFPFAFDQGKIGISQNAGFRDIQAAKLHFRRDPVPDDDLNEFKDEISGT